MHCKYNFKEWKYVWELFGNLSLTTNHETYPEAVLKALNKT